LDQIETIDQVIQVLTSNIDVGLRLPPINYNHQHARRLALLLLVMATEEKETPRQVTAAGSTTDDDVSALSCDAEHAPRAALPR